MAEHLASIFGTEKDRVNCPFYFKIGACRHGDRCSRLHTKPSISPTLLLSNMYQRPDMITPGVDPQGQPLDPKKIQHHFEDFYEDLFEELSKYGEIQNLNICDNLADHMVGNVYVQFREEDHAAAALQNLSGRFYAGRPIIVDFSPVTDFREATCRQYEENVCNRGGYCNFMHLKKISRELRRQLFGRSKRRRSRSRSASPQRQFNYGERSRGGRGFPRRGDHLSHERSRRPRSRSPGRRGGRSKSPGGRRNRSPIREGSFERRAMIELWNKEREQEGGFTKSYNSSPGERRNRSPTREGSAERRAMIEQWNREKEQAESAKGSSSFITNNGSGGGGKTEHSSNDEYQQHQEEDGNHGY
ncbi:splicing factor U2af small subunit B-like [Coffea eugenioides]|uniref:splicing factor U2af small subunit B-like n=1 Tax=Coffea eugenioides TaxID=49369 RepID=UPI000F608BDB|nr:splicing factor U2af small subunit B-like [Coffea eugenioides]XP_027175643.1 splicing factor U2af small subunit B-like [Coffea eugenioides]